MIEFTGAVPALGQALTKRGYTEFTPVQTAVLAPEYETADMLVSAQTGSGKTVAFGLAIASQLLAGKDRLGKPGAPLALAVAPTRELALQVRCELEWLYEYTGASLATCVGGMDMRDERRALERGAHILVGTPGRLRDHITRKSLDMSRLKAVILDEADEMLDLGFREDLEFILSAAPVERRTLMFSATVPRTIVNLAKRYQRDAVRISTQDEEKQHVDIEYRALSVASNDRENAIVNVLRYYEAKNALVFCGTRAMVNHMTSRFTNRGFQVVALSGELSQSERTHALQAMRDGRARVCIATDVAARGIDLPNLELVIHADIPKSSDTLKHRSGRTGRAGRKGVCVIIVPHAARRRTERLLQSANIEAEWAKPPTADEVMVRDDARILADPALSEEIKESERGLAAQLMANHTPEQIAAALVRRYRIERSAPEELADTPNYAPSREQGGRRSGQRAGQRAPRNERTGKHRDDFSGGIWFSLSVGRKHKAEPRWLIPMICGAAGFTKAQIGSIKIQDNETFIEIDPVHVDKFTSGLGPGNKLEKTISVKRVNGTPEFDDSRGERQYAKKTPYSERKRPAPQQGRHGSEGDNSGESAKVDGGQSWQKPGAPTAGKPKKPHKKKLARAAARDQGLPPPKKKKQKKNRAS